MDADTIVNTVLSHQKFKTVLSAQIDAQIKADSSTKEKAVSKKATARKKAVKK